MNPPDPIPTAPAKTIAIACQGGGSHTAFTGGVLQALLRNLKPSEHRIIGFSGTSGGALCATIAWYSLLLGDPGRGAELLEAFWRDMSAKKLPDSMFNSFLVWLQRSSGYLAMPEISPYQLPAGGQEVLADAIQRHVDFAQLPNLIGTNSPRLLVGAVDVLSGEFTVFHSHHPEEEKRITPEALLASAAIPELFRAVRIGHGLYWDGLFSENPPIRGFLAGEQSREDKPDEIWIIQINPEQRSQEPKLSNEITDRRNELAGNLSLNQELFFVDQTNKWLARGWLNAEQFKQVTVRHIPLKRELDYPSKLDRSPAFINGLLIEGQREGLAFLHTLRHA
ncbi:patatin-like phospholipase family protein [Dechloromonas sp. A34]|uniref:patatin-like phospholipase family protein n=1 Tax=Dechloromonas sp. A34 TaxID=447588 RepID=UPI002248D832|nr:patatin-like phospholipase family protein [Dechloromonas sp. A34]